jgi:hypothetical protein
MGSGLISVLADPERLAAVRQTNLLDTPAEDAFDRVARSTCQHDQEPCGEPDLVPSRSAALGLRDFPLHADA